MGSTSASGHRERTLLLNAAASDTDLTPWGNAPIVDDSGMRPSFCLVVKRLDAYLPKDRDSFKDDKAFLDPPGATPPASSMSRSDAKSLQRAATSLIHAGLVVKRHVSYWGHRSRRLQLTRTALGDKVAARISGS